MGGTIYLDELADIAPEMQPVLTEVVAGGGDVRVIAASNQDLASAVERGALDGSLVKGLKDVSILMPPLRDRKEDLCLLIHHFLEKFNAGREKRIYSVTPMALDYLLTYNWPGNLIQLENVIERAFALGVERVIDVEHLPEEIKAAGEISRIN
jgi:DNA-binding NtrC family response regulator